MTTDDIYANMEIDQSEGIARRRRGRAVCRCTRAPGKQRLTSAELDQLIGDRGYRDFLNPRSELYRERDMKEHPPSRAEALKLMAAEPILFRRPVVIAGKQIVLGYDEQKLNALG